MSRLNAGDEEITERATTLDSLFGSLSEVRGLLRTGERDKAEEACARALAKFPDHPLFKSGLLEVGKQKAEANARSLAEFHQRVDRESDFQEQAATLREALRRFPEEPSLLAKLNAATANQAALDGRIEKARSFETKRLFGEAIKEWEGIGHDYPWLAAVPQEVVRLGNVRRKDKQDAHDRWSRQVEDAIDDGDYESAGTMLRQAAQQRPDRQLQDLEAKLKAALQSKSDSDTKFAQGSRLLAEGSSTEGANLLRQAFELQPKDQERSNAIARLLMDQIRAKMGTDRGSCETLLAHLEKIRPNQPLPADLQGVFKREPPRQGRKVRSAETIKALEDTAREAELTRSKRNAAAVQNKVELLESRDVEPRRVAGDLLRKTNMSLSVIEKPRSKPSTAEPRVPNKVLPIGPIIAAAMLLLSLAAVVFFLSRPTHKVSGLPVMMSITPDHTTVEVDGQTCVTPNCRVFLKPGDYLLKLRKDGYLPRDVFVPVKPTDQGPVNVTAALQTLDTPTPAFDLKAFAKMSISGALPGTLLRLDGRVLGQASNEGKFSVYFLPGVHTVDLSLDGFASRSFTRTFVRGETVAFSKEEVQLQRSRPAHQP